MKYDPQYAKLYQAVRTGNWEATREFLNEHPEAVTARISTEGKLPLHVAALFGHVHIVKELLKSMSAEDVALQDFNKKLTALHEISYTSYIDIAECLVRKNNNLLTIPSTEDLLPVTRALRVGCIEMVRYLYSVIPEKVLKPEYGNHGATLLNMCYYSELLDIALDLLDCCPSLAVTPDGGGETFLEALASVPSAFPSGCQLSFWQRWIYDWIDIPKEQLRTSYREARHETFQPNSACKDISVDMAEATTTQSEETITTKKKSDNNTMVFSGELMEIFIPAL